ncbi:MAG: cytochrome-c peroxidase [Gaiellaceae bacterium]
MSARRLIPGIVATASALALLAILVGPSIAAAPAPHPILAPLGTVTVPEPPNLGDFVRDKQAAIVLGKALYWDMQVGSDGIQACATCHFEAGADSRSQNQLNPGTAGGHTTFDTLGPNASLKAADYPFHRLADPNDATSAVVSDTTAVTSSQGTVPTRFGGIVPGGAEENGAPAPIDPAFNVGGVNVRRVSPRNAPSTINAVFNDRQFWDGRAQNDFNGVNALGSRDPNAKVLEATSPDRLEPVQISLTNASLASQAVGPVTKGEMSYDGRTFHDLAKKLFSLQPLARQEVSATDSVLAPFAAPGRGLNVSYRDLVEKAFDPRWWQSNLIVRVDNGVATFVPDPQRPLAPNEFTMAEYNFSLYFGLAIDLYESTLVSDQTPFDKFMAGDSAALNDDEKQGFSIFDGGGKCSNCHGGPELTNASVENVQSQPLEGMEMADGQMATYDNGFYNIGVRPTEDDKGLGGADPFGKPLSMTRLAAVPGKIAADGAFKVPSLRNVALTAPYFHNGGQATLRQVVDFYSRGGDFAAHNHDNFDVDVAPLGLSDKEKDELVAFLNALTDPRVAKQSAPFDHPQLFVPNGHPSAEGGTVATDGGTARDQFLLVPAVGRDGGDPIPTFLDFTGPLVELTSSAASAAPPSEPVSPAPVDTAPPPPAADAPPLQPPAATPPAASPAPAAPPVAHAPLALRIGKVELDRRGRMLVVTTTVRVNRPATLHVRVLSASHQAVPLRAGSRVGNSRSGRVHLGLVAAVQGERTMRVLLRVRVNSSASARRYRLAFTAADGATSPVTTTITLRDDGERRDHRGPSSSGPKPRRWSKGSTGKE